MRDERTYYFELTESLIQNYPDGVKYIHASGCPHFLERRANRIWEERDGKITYVKLTSNWLHDMGNVDMAEFTWVKLQSIWIGKV